MKYLSYCGLKCNECPVFIATEKKDDDAKNRLAKDYSTDNCTLDASDIYCEGCRSEKISHKICSECTIRKCASSEGHETCADCIKYPCSKVESYIPEESENRKLLDSIHNSR